MSEYARPQRLHEPLSTTYSQHPFVFWLVLLALVVFLAIWLARTYQAMRRLESQFDELFEGISGENAVRMLAEYLGTVRSTATAVARIEQEHRRIAEVMPGVVRHVGLVRFSPFHDTGGDQSFALAILDARSDGVIITGLHSRNDSRLYAKPIESGASRYSLTPEEREAINRALHGSPVEAV